LGGIAGSRSAIVVKLLWVKSDFLHPTTKGGQIRTLETLRRLHRRHQVHYVAFEDPASPEGLRRSSEYASRAYPVPLRVPSKTSLLFAGQLARGLVSRTPVAVGRYRSDRMRRTIDELRRKENFDVMVCDFLVPSVNIGDMEEFVLFQHNVETSIWRRHAEHASDPLRRWYFGLQASRMFDYEGTMCRRAAHVIAVSEPDKEQMRKEFAVSRITAVPTGVDLEYFARPPAPPPHADLVFVGSMDWLPNIDGVRFFVEDVLPRLRRRRPDCSLAVVGRLPVPEIAGLASRDSRILVTGTVPDVRPYLWGSLVSIVPLRIGGGTRLKIYESMAARTPVVSTTVGAEGLDIEDGRNILLADTADSFADRCLELLEDAEAQRRLSEAAWAMVSARFSWEHVADQFASVLETASPKQSH
jgi:glycosyltransferase involved in cell wall biosynthesis